MISILNFPRLTKTTTKTEMTPGGPWRPKVYSLSSHLLESQILNSVPVPPECCFHSNLNLSQTSKLTLECIPFHLMDDSFHFSNLFESIKFNKARPKLEEGLETSQDFSNHVSVYCC